MSLSPRSTHRRELPPFGDRILSVDLRLAIVREGTPEPNRLNHLTNIVGGSVASTSVGLPTTVKTDGEMLVRAITGLADLIGYTNSYAQTGMTNLLVAPINAKLPFQMSTSPQNPTRTQIKNGGFVPPFLDSFRIAGIFSRRIV